MIALPLGMVPKGLFHCFFNRVSEEFQPCQQPKSKPKRKR